MIMKSLDHDQVFACLPDREPWAHKGCFGKILLLCGSVGYTGAAALAAMGALRTGAGLVYVGVPSRIYAIEAIKLTEAVVFPLPDDGNCYSVDAAAEVQKALKDKDAVLFGCGSGRSQGCKAVLETILREYEGPVVLDADGINLLVKHKDIVRERTGAVILTPHDGEFARIGGQVGENRVESAARLASDLGCVVLLKGHHSVITDGTTCYLNHTGNPGMAVGGSGDVLAGMITSLLGQGLRPLEAAACAAWIHGRAGDVCAQEIGQQGMLPTDMLQVLPRLLK